MRALQHLFSYWSYTMAVMAIVVGVGGSVLAPLLRRLRPVERLALCASVGYATLILASTGWAYTERHMAPIAAFALAVAVVGWVLLTRASGGDGDSPRPKIAFIGRSIGIGACAALVSLVQYRRVFTSPWLPSGRTAFTNANNDLAIYILEADNVREVGFGSLGRVAAIHAGELTLIDHTGSATLYALVSATLRSSVMSAAVPVLAGSVALTGLLVVALCSRLGLRHRSLLTLAGLWAVLAPLSADLQTNFFLGQIVSLTLLAGLVFASAVWLLPTSELRETTSDRASLIAVTITAALTTAAGLLAYPIGHLATMAFAGLIAAGFAAAGSTVLGARRQIVRLAGLGGAVVVGALLVAPRWSMIRDSIVLYSGAGTAGWSRQTGDIRILLGLPGTPQAAISPFDWLLVVAVAGLVTGGVAITVRQRQWVHAGSGAILVVGGVLLYGVAVLAWGPDEYQTWKTLGTVQALMVAGLVVLAAPCVLLVTDRVRIHGRGRFRGSSMARATRLVAVACFTAVLAVSAQGKWAYVTATKDTFDGRHVRSQVVAAGSSPLVRAQVDLRIFLSDYFETMVAPVAADLFGTVYGTTTYFDGADGTQTYFTQPTRLGTCILTDERYVALLSGPGYGDPLAVGDGMVLVPAPTCNGLPQGDG